MTMQCAMYAAICLVPPGYTCNLPSLKFEYGHVLDEKVWSSVPDYSKYYCIDFRHNTWSQIVAYKLIAVVGIGLASDLLRRI